VGSFSDDSFSGETGTTFTFDDLVVGTPAE